jgi:hypothetical protein
LPGFEFADHTRKWMRAILARLQVRQVGRFVRCQIGRGAGPGDYWVSSKSNAAASRFVVSH